MKFTNFYRENWRGLGDWALTTLDGFVAGMQGSWRTEHTDADRHGHVHGLTLQIGRTSINNIIKPSWVGGTIVHDFNDPLLRDAGLMRVTITGAGNVTLSGMQIPLDELGVSIDARTLLIENLSTTTSIILTHEDATSNPTSRFSLPMATVSIAILPRHIIQVIYDRVRARWRVVGQWGYWHDVVNPVFATGTAATWGVDPGDITTLAYHLVGDKMTVDFDIRNTDVSAGTTELTLVIPEGRVATKGMRNLVQVIDAGAAGAVGIAAVNATQNVIRFFSTLAGGGWAGTAADNTYVIGQITFQVDPL
jgi:hypothetical protein